MGGGAGAVGEGVKEDAVAQADAGEAAAVGVPGEADAGHGGAVEDGGDAFGDAPCSRNRVAGEEEAGGGAGLLDGLDAGDEGVEAIADFGEGGVHFPAEAVVEGEARGDAPFVLGEEGALPAAEAAREVAEALVEDDGAAEEEVGKGVVGGEAGREDEEGVGGDGLEDVQVGAAEFATELEGVAATIVVEGAIDFAGRLGGGAGAGDGATDGRVAVDVEEGKALASGGGGIVVEAEGAGEAWFKRWSKLKVWRK